MNCPRLTRLFRSGRTRTRHTSRHIWRQTTGHFLGELLCVLGDVRLKVDGSGMLHRLVLLVGRGNDMRMTMPHADGDNSTQAIQITLSLVVPEPNALPSGKSNRETQVGVH